MDKRIYRIWIEHMKGMSTNNDEPTTTKIMSVNFPIVNFPHGIDTENGMAPVPAQPLRSEHLRDVRGNQIRHGHVSSLAISLIINLSHHNHSLHCSISHLHFSICYVPLYI